MIHKSIFPVGSTSRQFLRFFKTKPIQKLPLMDRLVDVFQHNPTMLVGFDNTKFVCALHALETTPTLIDALIRLGAKKHNIYMMDKYYSTSPAASTVLADLLGDRYLKLQGHPEVGYFPQFLTRGSQLTWDKVTADLQHDRDTQHIVILDDGGALTCSAPHGLARQYGTIAVEQTSNGLKKIERRSIPYVNVAKSLCKSALESRIIADDLINHINSSLLPMEQRDRVVCSIIGKGSIGSALAKKLHEMGFPYLLVYDEQWNQSYEDIEGLVRCSSLEQAIVEADYIFGCTGEDLLSHINDKAECFRFIFGYGVRLAHKTFFSCSSEDVEWHTLLRYIAQGDKHGRVKISASSAVEYVTHLDNTIVIGQAGFPINFNQAPESIPPEKIQLTRTLMLAGAVQALYSRVSLPTQEFEQKKSFKLDATLQKFIVDTWLSDQTAEFVQRYDKQLIDHFNDTDLIAKLSGGVHSLKMREEIVFPEKLSQAALSLKSK